MTEREGKLPPDGSPDDKRQLRELIARHWHRQMTSDESRRFNELLAADPAAVAMYARYSVLQSLLELEGGFAKSPPSDAGAASPSPLMGESLPASIAPPVQSPVLGFLGGVVNYVSHSRMFMFWLTFAALAGVFSIHFGGLLLSRIWDQNAQVAGGGAQRHAAQPIDHPVVPAGKIVARLTNAIDCKWEVPNAGATQGSKLPPLDVNTEFFAGQQLNLAAGLAEITFDSGAKVILHGPAQFAVSEALGGDLQWGKLIARVPHSAYGFTIGTPSGKVVDLGTEFGVKVNFDHTMHVVVYVGDVVVDEPPGAGGKTQGPIHVHAGEAIVVSPGHPVKSIDPKEERYVRDLTPLGNKQDAETSYLELVKKLKPAVWFRMEGADADRTLHDEMGAMADVKLAWDGPGNPFVKGRIGKGLWLRGEKLKDCAIVPDYPKAEHGKLTVAAWAYAESRSNFASIAKNWHHGDGLGQFHFGLISKFNPDDGSYHPDGEDLGVEVAQADGTTATVREGAEHAFPLGQWQHVAFVVDSDNVHLYRQGREVAVAKCAGLKFPVGLKALGIGCKTDEAGKAPDFAYPGYWTGKLDEITIFNNALTAEDIQKLSAAAPR